MNIKPNCTIFHPQLPPLPPYCKFLHHHHLSTLCYGHNSCIKIHSTTRPDTKHCHYIYTTIHLHCFSPVQTRSDQTTHFCHFSSLYTSFITATFKLSHYYSSRHQHIMHHITHHFFNVPHYTTSQTNQLPYISTAYPATAFITTSSTSYHQHFNTYNHISPTPLHFTPDNQLTAIRHHFHQLFYILPHCILTFIPFHNHCYSQLHNLAI